MLRPLLAALGLSACLALAVAGCGSSSSTTSSPTGGSTTSPEASTSTTAPSTETTTHSETGTQGGGSNKTGSGSSSGGSAPATESGGDNSIQTYGSAAAGAEKAKVADAARSFFTAMASSDYNGLCSDLSASNRAQLQAFLKAKPHKGGCPGLLKTLIPSTVNSEARKAANASASAVRIKGDTAFVLFTPKGGNPSYFVMKEEGGAWKAISLAPGTPLNPTAAP